MILRLECECGNKIKLSALPKKYLQLRDNLETQGFYYDGANIKDDILQEFRICCGKCGSWIALGVD